MSDTAAWLVDRVFPELPIRQWVLTLPVSLRYRMAYDAELTSAGLTEFLRAIFGSLRRRARGAVGTIRYAQCGAVTFVQRAGDALNLSQREDGRLQYRLRHRWRDGTTHMLFERDPSRSLWKSAASTCWLV